MQGEIEIWYTPEKNEQILFCERLGVKYVMGEYDHGAWRASVSGLVAEPERGARCSRCFEFRFEYAAQFARRNGYNAVASVFGVSRHKDQSQVDDAGVRVLGNSYMPVKWDEALRQQIGRASDFYRQNYCGCEFSIRKV